MPNSLNNLQNKLYSVLFPTFHSHAGEYQTCKVQVNGINLNYAFVGHGPSLIFIHGWTNNWEGWIPIVSYLKDGYTLYLIDMPGFGDSDNLSGYSIPISSDYIASFIKTLPAKPRAIAGVSMGSFVAADVALRYPQLIHTAVLTGPVIKDGRYKVIPEAFDIFLNMIHRSSLSESALKRLIETRAAAYLLAKYLNMYKFKKDLVDEYGMVGKQKVRKGAYVEMGISASSYDLKSAIEKISIPTLLVLGRQDKYTDFDFVRKNILPNNSHLKLQIIPDAGHVVPWEKPEEVAEAIKSFLAAC